MNTPLERLKALRDRLLSMDSASGEAADLALALVVVDVARKNSFYPANTVPWGHIVALDDAISALNTPDRGDTK